MRVITGLAMLGQCPEANRLPKASLLNDYFCATEAKIFGPGHGPVRLPHRLIVAAAAATACQIGKANPLSPETETPADRPVGSYFVNKHSLPNVPSIAPFRESA